MTQEAIQTKAAAEPERIAAAAVCLSGVVHSLPPPNRHHHILHALHETEGERIHRADQGFVTNTGRFVGRKQAQKIAEAAGQIKEKLGCPGLLFSEDLW